MSSTTWTAEQRSDTKRMARAAPSVFLTVFFVTILMPIKFELGGLALSPNRIFLLIATVPQAILVLGGKAGRVTGVDIMMTLFGVWIILALIAVHGTERIPFAGITSVELVGGYFCGRLLVRNVDGYRTLIKLMLWSMVFLLPFALVETLTGKLVIPDLLRSVFQTPSRASSAYGRIGLERVYAVFSHPILFGLFCSMAFANVFFLFSQRKTLLFFAIGLTFGMTFLSLSSAPLLACAMQIGLLCWNRIMGGRWIMLLGLVTVMYVAIDIASNRTPVTILIELATFNSTTGWIRLAIFDYGWAAAIGSPLFGIGFNDWFRPEWLTPSVDNFWLLTAMRYGFPGAFLIVLSVLVHLIKLMQAPIKDKTAKSARVAYGIVLFSVSFTLMTVHVWDTMSSFTTFFVGAGAWLYTSETVAAPATPSVGTKPAKISQPWTRYARSADGSPSPHLVTRSKRAVK